VSIRIRSKIIISFGAIITLLSLLGYLGYHSRNLLMDVIFKLEDGIHELGTITDLQLSIERSVMPPNDYLITGSEDEKERFRVAVEEVELGLERLAAFAHEGHAGLDRSAADGFVELKAKAGEIFAIRDPVGNSRGARLMKELDAMASDIIVNSLEKSYGVVKGEVNAEIALEAAARKRVNRFIAVGAAVSFLTVILLIIYLARSIIRPILLFKEGALIIGRGNLDHRVDLRDGLEMNLLADEFNQMALRLKDSYADLERNVEDRTRELKELNILLKKLSITDGLTGAHNKRHFIEKLSMEVKRARRYSRPVSLIMADIDHFKHYNDTNGHVEGDNALKGIADCIMKTVRKEDFVARYGGEEFTIILPETDGAGARMIAERVRLSVIVEEFPNEDKQPRGMLTISLGIATLSGGFENHDDLIIKADRALYRAKDNGRNRVEAE
jgi:diguanylate cyclase (GGDEF)-like protein